LSDKSLTISAQDLDFSNEAIEQMTCVFEGTPMRIAFNAKFLVEMLNSLDSDDIKMEFSTPSRAGILLPAEQEANEEILMLVMPVMLNN
jgi:DNA polymerase-3 subunit beta